MAEIRMASAGVKLLYAVEGTAGTRPTAASAYTEIAEITEIPEVGNTPEALDATPLSVPAGDYRVYVDGLRDPGGIISLTANFSQAMLTNWNTTIIGAYTTGIASGKSTWFCVTIPGFTQSFYFEGKPDKIGLPGMSVGDVLRCTLPIVPTGKMLWDTAPTT